jgi:hypothetical protein
MTSPSPEIDRDSASRAPAAGKPRVTPGEWLAFILGGVAGWMAEELIRWASGPSWMDHAGGAFAVAGGVCGVALFTAVKSRNVR